MNAASSIALVGVDNAGQAVVRRFLTRAGHVVSVEAQCGAELIQVFQAAAPRPALIIVDFEMPNVDGLQAAADISMRQDVPVIVMSRDGSDGLVRLAEICHPFAYLIKPVRQAELNVAVTVALERFQEFHLLRVAAAEAEQALEDRKVIERAKGVIMKRRGVDEASAFHRLQGLARERRQKMVEVARNIVLVESHLEHAT